MFALDKKLREIYRFEETSGYDLITKARFAGEIRQIFVSLDRGHEFKTRDANEIHEQIFSDVIIEEEEAKQINNYPNLVPLQDCLFNLTLQESIPYQPEYLYTFKVLVPYSDSFDCPEFRAFINRTLPNRKYQMNIFTYLCYCLTPSTKYQIIQIWAGDGKNGKSELSTIFDLMLGNYVCHITFDQFMKGNQFLTSDLVNALVNVASELTEKLFGEQGINEMKRLSGEKYIRSEGKFDSAINFMNKVKHIFPVNNTPPLNEYTDYPFLRRWQIIPFLERIKKEDREFDIMARIFKDEGPQIVRFLLSFYEHLDTYIIEDAEEAERLWGWHNKSAYLFYDLYCSPSGHTLAEDAFEAYISFCKHNQKTHVSRQHFGRMMRKKDVYRARMNSDIAEEIGIGFDSADRPWCYTMTVNYDNEAETKDIERRVEWIAERKIFLEEIVTQVIN